MVQRAPEPTRLDPDDRILLRIEVRPAIEGSSSAML